MGRWEELMNEIPTDNSKIDWYPVCKGCIFVEDDGTGTAHRKAACIMYDWPYGKPPGLADGSVACPYYESEGMNNGNVIATARTSDRHKGVSGR